MKYFAIAIFAVLIGTLMPTQARAQIFFQGFETDTSGWFPHTNDTITRVPSGSSDPNYASGINAASGNFFARLGLNTGCTPTPANSCGGPFTSWGSSFTSAGVPMPPSGSVSELAIYLDMSFAGTHSDYRFDWDSALVDANGNFLQDYIFNAGTGPVVPDLCGPAPHFTIAASFNSQRGSAFPQNPAFNPQCITASGWYTFRHTFRPDSLGNLEVDMDILNSGGATVASYVRNPICMGCQATGSAVDCGVATPPLCTAGQPLPFSGVGFNAYGWHSDQEISGLAIDNTLLRPRQPNTKDDCKDGNWKLFTDPSFKNQGQCVKFVDHDKDKEKNPKNDH